MTMRATQFKAAVIQDGALTPGQFKAIVSVFDNRDSYGDIIRKGAFTDTLKAWEASGRKIPVIWAHDWADPFSHIGTVLKATETDRGLEIVGEITADEQASNPKASQIYRLLKEGRIGEFSFAYDVIEGGEIEENGQYAYELRKLDLHEVGPCLIGVNRATELLGVKAEDIKTLTTALAAVKAEQMVETSPPAASGEGTEEKQLDDTPTPRTDEVGSDEPVSLAIANLEMDLIQDEIETGEIDVQDR